MNVRYPTPAPTAKTGFALIISLVLMGMVFLLMLSLSTLIRVDTQTTSTQRQISQARSNALLGLKAAIGQTQLLLGPDTRISAEAGLLDDTAEGKEHWLGVWKSDGTGEVTWLVSGEQTASEPLTGNEPELVGEASASEPLQAPLVTITGPSDISGGYAYWVSDLSTRARIDLVDTSLPGGNAINAPSVLTGTPTFGVSIMDGLDTLSAAAGTDSEASELRNQLQQLQVHSDLGLINETYKQPSKEHFYALTTGSYGLQTNVVDSGMKTDLTSLLATDASTPNGRIYPDGPPWSLLRDYLEMKDEFNSNGSMDPVGRNPTLPTEWQHGTWPDRHGISPLILAWDFGFRLWPQAPPEEGYDDEDIVPLHLQVEPVVVMVNPYDVPLAQETYVIRITSGSSSYPGSDGNYHRFPAFRAAFPPNAYSGGWNADSYLLSRDYGHYVNEWLPNLSGGSGNDFQENGLRVTFSTSFEPGEIKVFSLASNTPIPGKNDGFLIPLAVGEPMGHVAQSKVDLNTVLDKQFTGADYDRWENGDYSLLLQPLTGSVVANLYIGSEDKSLSNSLDSENLTSTQRVRNLSFVYSETPHIGAFLKGPIEKENSLRKPKSINGSQTLAHYNIRSQYQSTALPSAQSGGDFTSAPTYSPATDSSALYNGIGQLWDTALYDPASGEYRLVLFHVPQEDPVSLGELQNADLTRNSYAPTYAIGNSLASPWVPANGEVGEVEDFEDVSYRLNKALWDDYFLSSIPQENDEAALPRNPRLDVFRGSDGAPTADQLRDPEESAAWLLTKGPFNVNSTSVDAWAALLAGLRAHAVEYDDVLTDGTANENIDGGAFARAPIPAGPSVPRETDERADDDTSAYWRGFRNLTDTQIRNLSGQIVYQVRQRGPFLSLAKFVNRNPYTTQADDAKRLNEQLAGALQAALDSDQTVTVDEVDYPPANVNPALTASKIVASTAGESYGSNEGGPPGYAFIEAVEGSLRSSMAPGYLTQADILAGVGPVLTVRGDTFLIRAYGVVNDPLSGDPIASARCEAVIQRMPDYLNDPAQAPEEVANASNETFGRRFRITSFRWLANDEY